MDDEEADLAAIVEIGMMVQPQPKQHPQRSWQLCEKARAAKALKRARLAHESEERRREDAERRLDHVASTSSHVSALVGIRARRAPMDSGRAATVAQLAFRPAIRGSDVLRQSQNQAVSLTASFLMDMQNKFAESLFLKLAPAAPEAHPSFVAHVLGWQWDETSQHLRAPFSQPLGLTVSFAGQGVQVMMQAGRMVSYHVVDGDGRVCSQDPFFCRALLVQRTRADDLISGMLRRFPFDITDPATVHAVSNRCDIFILAFTMDRVSANFGVLHWLFTLLCGEGMPRNLLPFAEPCAPHGVALVKGRLCVEGSVVAPSHTFSALMRNTRFVGALRDAMLGVLRSKLRIARCPRPEASVASSLRLADALLGGLEAEWLYTKGDDGRKTPGSLLRDVRALVDILELGQADGAITHWCYVCEGSIEHEEGGKVGDPCCASFEVALEKVAVPLINVLLQRPWSRSSENRWTYVVVTLRRLALGYLAGRALPDSLRELKTHWDLSDKLVPMLERLVAADRGEYHNTSKLRLLRLCRSLCSPRAPFCLALELTVLARVDSLLYETLGDNRRSAAKLSKLVDQADSIVAAAEQELCRLMQQWSPDAVAWRLLVAFGVDFDCADNAMSARAAVLAVSASLYDHFVHRLSQPPYTLAKLCDASVGAAEREAVASDFLGKPGHCLSLFCRRLRDHCPSPQALVREAPHIMAALDAGLSMGVDFIERSHASMRQAVQTSGRARNSTVAANRVFCAQVRAEHLQRAGVDLAKTLRAPVADDAPLSDAVVPAAQPGQLVGLGGQRAGSRRGGNPEMSWRNHKLKVHKQLHAQGRTLTNAELADFRTAAKQEWASLPADEKEHWRMVWLGEREQRLLVPATAAETVAERREFVPLWGGCPDPCCPLPLPDMVRLHSESNYRARRARARHDPDIVQNEADVPRRAAGHADMRLLFCCWAQRKNVCRAVLPASTAREMDSLTGRLNAWADRMSAETARGCGQLLWIHGESAADPPHRSGRGADLCVVLVDRRSRPKMQIFARCFVPSAGQELMFSMPEFPVLVRLAAVPSTVAPRFEALSLCTSDTLCLQLAELGMEEWVFRPLEWSLPPTARNLMDMLVTSAGDPIQRKAPMARVPPSRVCPEFASLAAMDCDDDEGGSLNPAQASASSDHASEALVGDDGVVEQMDDVGIELDPDDFGNLPADLVKDVMEEFRCVLGAEGMDPEVLEATGPDERADEQSEASDPGVLTEAAGAPPASADAEDERDPIDAAIAAASVSSTGHITSDFGHWAALRMVGRITSWPAHLPEERRSFSCKCYLHPGCSSAAVRRHTADNNALMRWLFAGALEPDAVPSRKKELREEHMKLWTTMFPKPAPAAKKAKAKAQSLPSSSHAAAGAASSSASAAQ